MNHLALVTGGGRRVGRAIALRLAAAGCDLAVHHNASARDAKEVAAAAEAMGRRAVTVAFDVTHDQDLIDGLAQIEKAFGRAPDVLVNSASIFEWDDIATVERPTLERHFETNLFGPVMLTRAIVARSPDNVRGLIINLLDQKLFNPNPDHLSYTLTKYALKGFTELMARQLAPRFRVNAIAPGYALPGPGETYEAFAARHNETPLARGPTEDDLADAAAYLLGALAVTGQTLIIDGGSHLAPADRDFAFR